MGGIDVAGDGSDAIGDGMDAVVLAMDVVSVSFVDVVNIGIDFPLTVVADGVMYCIVFIPVCVTVVTRVCCFVGVVVGNVEEDACVRNVVSVNLLVMVVIILVGGDVLVMLIIGVTVLVM